MRKLVGHVVNGNPTPGPPCDLTKAFLGTAMCSNNPSQNCCSTRDAASCCHPDLIPPGS